MFFVFLFFVFNPYEQTVYGSAWQKLSCWTLLANFSTKLFHTCQTYRQHWPRSFYRTFSDLDVGFIFSHTSTHPDEIWYVDAIQVEHVHITLECVLFNCFTDCIKNFGVVMSFDSIVLIWFKLNIMIHTTGFYILILVLLTSTISQSHRGGGKQNLQIQWSHKVFYGLEWNLACCWDLVDWWTSFSFYLLKMNF